MAKNNPQNGPTYTIIPNKAFDALIEREHSHADILVYQVLSRHLNKESQLCWPSLEKIAELASLHRTNASKSINNLCSSGMILKNKYKNSKAVYENNTYYLPHHIDFQIEYLLTQKKTSKSKQLIQELQALKITVQDAINKQITSSVTLLRSSAKLLRSSKKHQGSSVTPEGVVAQNVTNNTTNITINSTKNVTSKETSNNEDLPLGLKSIKRYDTEFSKAPIEALNNSNTLLKIKREGLVQQLADELNDEKSIPFFRSLVSKFTDHEDTIYKCLSLTRETQELAGIKTTRGAVFTDHIKREAEKLGIEL